MSDAIKIIDWRNESPEDVHDEMENIMENFDCYEFTIDDLRNDGVDDSLICEVMQCYNIYTTMSMI